MSLNIENEDTVIGGYWVRNFGKPLSLHMASRTCLTLICCVF